MSETGLVRELETQRKDLDDTDDNDKYYVLTQEVEDLQVFLPAD